MLGWSVYHYYSTLWVLREIATIGMRGKLAKQYTDKPKIFLNGYQTLFAATQESSPSNGLLINTINHRCETSTQPLNLETDILHTAIVWLSMELILSAKFLFFQLSLVQ